MNEKAEQLIIDASEKVLAYLEATEGFAVEQAPLLAQEIVRYGIWVNTINALFSFAIFSGMWMVVCWAVLNGKFRKWVMDVSDGAIYIGVVALGVFSVFPLSMGTRAFGIAFKAFIAPRLYIMEQIAGLL